MKNLFAYDFTTNTIVASKATLKKAGNPTTPEYKALMKMIAEQPTFKVVCVRWGFPTLFGRKAPELQKRS